VEVAGRSADGLPPSSACFKMDYKNRSRSVARGADWWRASAAGRFRELFGLRCNGSATASPKENNLRRSIFTERTHELSDYWPHSVRVPKTLSEVGP